MPMNGNIQAIIWDYDGTLVDTRRKNLNVTRTIVEKITGVDSNKFPALQTLENYGLVIKKSANWNELYKQEFAFTDEQIDSAGRSWTEYQLKDNTPTPFYDGIKEVISALRRFPNGIVSQNSQESITRTLKDNNLLQYFGSIVGYEEVELRRQKPEPDGLLMCVEKLTELSAGLVFYIGDHETDVKCASNANHVLKKNESSVKIISIGALYCSGDDASDWGSRPDYKAKSAKNIIEIVSTFQ
jgi:HAD superfamily hydrolase (TIGR01549 family)